MDLVEFRDEILRLGKFYNRKMNEEQQDMWYEEIGQYPAAAVTAIFKEIKRTKKQMPTIQDAKAAYGQWLFDNPELRVWERENCDECGGRGYIEAWYQSSEIKGFVINGVKHPLWYHKLCACALCNNWERIFPPSGEKKPKKRWTKTSIVMAGMELEDPDPILTGRKGEYKGLNHAADKATRRM